MASSIHLFNEIFLISFLFFHSASNVLEDCGYMFMDEGSVALLREGARKKEKQARKTFRGRIRPRTSSLVVVRKARTPLSSRAPLY